MEGWIKLHRKMLDNPIDFKDSEYIAVWIYLLLMASHNEYTTIFKGKKIMLQPGQLVTGRKAISVQTKVHESKVRRILEWFKNDHQIEQQPSNQNSLITIINWDYYQNFDQGNDQSLKDKRTTIEHNQECKKVKKVKKDIIVSKDTISMEPNKSAPSQPPVFSLPLNDNSMYGVTNEDYTTWVDLYPAVDVMQELKKMYGWLDANPAKKKTRRGIKSFITRWLSKQQDKGGNGRKEENVNNEETVGNENRGSASDYYRKYIPEWFASREAENKDGEGDSLPSDL